MDSLFRKRGASQDRWRRIFSRRDPSRPLERMYRCYLRHRVRTHSSSEFSRQHFISLDADRNYRREHSISTRHSRTRMAAVRDWLVFFVVRPVVDRGVCRHRGDFSRQSGRLIVTPHAPSHHSLLLVAAFVALTIKSRRNAEYFAPVIAIWVPLIWEIVDVRELWRFFVIPP